MGIVLIVAITTAMSSGLAGGSVYTTTLAAIGPFGIVGGLVSLCVFGLVSSLITDSGVDKIMIAIISDQLKTRNKEELADDINNSKLISKDMKLKICDCIKMFKPIGFFATRLKYLILKEMR